MTKFLIIGWPSPPISASPRQNFMTPLKRRWWTGKFRAWQFPGWTTLRAACSSDKRTYLHLVREQLAFDVCAAPFGQDFFFSCRTIFSVPLLNLWHVLLALSIFSSINLALVKPLGPVFGGVAGLTLLLAILVTCRNAVKAEFAFLDTLLLETPVLSPLYWVLFRRDTYYRQDTRMMYMEIVPKIIQEHLDHVTAAKGVTLVRQYERAPVFGDLYKPLPPKPEPKP